MSLQPITLTRSAVQRLNALSEAEGQEVMLRVAVDGGGCSGFQYRLDLVTEIDPEDLVIAGDGARALTDEVSQPLLAGSMIDFVDELVGAQFKILNPNAKSSCGCGVSFSI